MRLLPLLAFHRHVVEDHGSAGRGTGKTDLRVIEHGRDETAVDALPASGVALALLPHAALANRRSSYCACSTRFLAISA